MSASTNATFFSYNNPVTGPFDQFDLDGLLAGAARLRPHHIALRDLDGAEISFATLHQHATTMAVSLSDVGLMRGERLMVLADARQICITAMLAGLRAGLDVVMVPSFIEADALTALCQILKPSAVLSCARFDKINLIDMVFKTAVHTRSIKFIGTLDEPVSGAAHFAPEFLNTHHLILPAQGGTRPCVISIAPDMSPHRHEQKLLIAAGLDYVTRAHIGMRQTIMQLLSPTSLAGLISGPVACLLSGATLALHAPFETSVFLSHIVKDERQHLVAPLIMSNMLSEAGLLTQEYLYSVAFHQRGSKAAEDHLTSDVLRILMHSHERDTEISLSCLGSPEHIALNHSTTEPHVATSPAMAE